MISHLVESPLAPACVEELSDTESLLALRAEWDALLEVSRPVSVFQTWEWQASCWQHVYRGHRLRLLAVRVGGTLIGLVPLVERPRTLAALPPCAALEWLGACVVGSDYLDVIARAGEEQRVAAAAAEHLAKAGRVLVLGKLGEHAAAARKMAEALGERGFVTRTMITDQCAFASFTSQSWDEYFEGLGRRHQRGWQNALRKLEREHSMHCELVRTDAQRQQVLEVMHAWHEARWNGASDAFSDPSVRAFQDSVTKLLLERNWLRLFMLKVDREPAAAAYCLYFRNGYSYYQAGWNPRFGELSVGTVLLGLAIQHAIGEGAREFDFLHGLQPYKLHWGKTIRNLTKLELFPPGAVGTAVRAEAAMHRNLRRAARRVVQAVRQ